MREDSVDFIGWPIRFAVYGMLGWCGEVIWTAVTRKLRGDAPDWRLLGETSLWAFPMYGSAVFLFEPVHQALRGKLFLVRGLIYLLLFWAIEFIGGWLVWRLSRAKPWDYSRSPGGSLLGLIRWNFALVWPLVGFAAEVVHDFLAQVTPAMLAALH